MKRNDKSHIEILIAEDSPTQAEQLKQLLEEHHYSVSTAPNGKAALAQIALHQPALVISDVMMPELDGYGLSKAIKTDDKLKHIPVMLVTTLSDSSDVIRGLECGADNFIRKPYDEKYLLSRIEYLLMNVELRKNQRMQMALEIEVGGKKHTINAERQQILDLLVSTYEQAVSVNVELKQREQELAHSNQVLLGLNRIAEGLNQAVTEQEVAQAALQQAMEVPGVQGGWICMREGETGFRLVAECNLPPSLMAPGALDGACACRKQLLSGKLDTVSNIIACERLAKAAGDTNGLRYHATVPLWLGDRTVGLMNLVGPNQGLFDEAELKVLHGVGNQVAVAMERARLHEHLEQLIEERTAALRTSEAHLRTIIEAEPECVKIVDEHGQLVQMNAAGLAMIEADSLEQVQGTSVAAFVVAPQREAYRAFERSVLKGKQAAFEFEIVGLKGTHRWLDTHAVPLPEPRDGRPQMLAIVRDISERKLAEAKLKLFRTLLDKSSDAIEVLDPATLRFLDINETECRILGYSREELLSMHASDIDPNFGTDALKTVEAQLRQSGNAQFETLHRRKDGSTFPVEINATIIEFDKPYMLSIARDITLRKANEDKIKRLNRIYAVLSGINATIVRVREEEELFRESCRIVAEHGRLCFAWIGKFDAATRQMTPVAQAGRDDGYLAQLDLSGREDIPGSCVLATQALTEAKPVVCNDIAGDPRMTAMRSAALQRGYRSVAVFPLLLEQRPWGVFALYAAEPDAFDDEEMKLLIEMSGDISYAMDHLRLEGRRNQAEDELRKLSLAVEQSQNSIVITNLDAKIEYVNEGFVKSTGYSREEAIGRNPSILHSGKNPQSVYADMWAHLTRGEVWKGEFINRRKDGSEYTESIFVSPVRDADGRVTHYLAIKEDITEFKRAEAALRDSRESLHRMLNSMAEGAYGVDTQGKCTFVNRACLQILGYQDADEMLGRYSHELFHHSHVDGSPYPASECKMFRALLKNQTINVSDEVFWRKDGVAIPVEYRSHPIVTDGAVIGAIITFIDITERKQAEEALLQLNESLEQRVEDRTADLERARREADSANRAKSAFLATMSHEIRTPMNGVIGMVDVLAQSRLSEHQIDLVKTIRESANALLSIIDDILDFSKIEAGRLEFERRPVAIADLVENLCNTLIPVAVNKGVDLSVFVSPDIPEQVLSDETRLRQILYNLIGNAIKFSKSTSSKHGRVSVRVDIAQAAPLRLALHVIDNGIGMAPETINGLFSPFSQAEISTTRRFGGTGLGLAICKRLVDMMQGEFEIKSTLGMGSTFTVTMPFEVAADQHIRVLPNLSELDCIILEGPAIHADDLRAYLEHAGARVQLARDAKAAARTATKLEGKVVVILEAENGTEPTASQTLFADLPNVHRLLITRGRRRRARVDTDTMVTLDGDALRRLAILRAVAVAAGRASPEIFYERLDESMSSEDPPPTIAEARAQGRLILVAEDDELNQKVILKQLELLGYAAEIAGNGVEALRLWRNGDYGLLLTDLHMPEMDGYTLAKTIRQEEAGTDRLPILALTANALRGEAGHALDSGMDEYLTKPILLSTLKSILEKWLPNANASGLPPTPLETQEPLMSVVDVNVLRNMVGNNPDTLREFLVDYLASALGLAKEMDVALAAGDARQIGAIAHKLKSSSRAVGALALGDLCADLENFGKTGDKEGIVQGIPQFDAAMADVEAEITRLLAE